jgi:hypothetical protein
VAAFPAGTETCTTRTGISGGPGVDDYSFEDFGGEPASIDVSYLCPGAKYIVTGPAVDEYGQQLPVGALLTLDGDYYFVRVSGWLATPTPTQTPTPAPMPEITEDDLMAACSGTPIPQAAKYAGTVHPLVVVDAWGLDDTSYDINAKWSDDLWPGPIQLVLCVDDAIEVKVGSCGTYTRKSDGAVGQIIRYKDTQKVRVIVATTGKQTGYKTLAGSTPQCAASLSLPASGPPPWDLYGDDPTAEAINAYARSVSK